MNTEAWDTVRAQTERKDDWLAKTYGICILELLKRVDTWVELQSGIRDRLEALEAKLATAGPCSGEPVATEPDYESWVGDLVVNPDSGQVGVLAGVEHDSFIHCRVFKVLFGEGSVVSKYVDIRLATPEDRRRYTGTPPTEAGQWCMVRDDDEPAQPWEGPAELAAVSKDGKQFYIHTAAGDWVDHWDHARLCTPFELRQAGKDGAE